MSFPFHAPLVKLFLRVFVLCSALQLAPGRGAYGSLSSLLVAHATRSSPAIPVVIFPEGQKSNGLCILQWCGGEDKNSAAAGFDAPALRLLEGRVAEIGCMYDSISVKSSEQHKTPLGRRVPYGPAHTVRRRERRTSVSVASVTECGSG